MTHVERITNPLRIVELWDVFRDGLKTIVSLTKERMSEEDYLKMLLALCERNDAWIGVVIQTNTGGPLSYGVAVDSTPLGTTKRTFTVVSFYAMPGRADATETLMQDFESWAREHGAASYIVTTRRETGAAIKCFRSGRYGFRKSYTAFEKTL